MAPDSAAEHAAAAVVVVVANDAYVGTWRWPGRYELLFDSRLATFDLLNDLAGQPDSTDRTKQQQR